MTVDPGDLIYLLLLILLPASALAARRLPLTGVAKMAAAWIAIFGVLLILVLGWQLIAGAGAQIGGVFQ